MPSSDLTLVLGGARAGKSAFAEGLAQAWERRVYMATAVITDDEMAERIASHRARRGADWRTVEEPVELAAAVRRESAPDTCLLVDCLTVWLGNLMHHGRDVDAACERPCSNRLPPRPDRWCWWPMKSGSESSRTTPWREPSGTTRDGSTKPWPGSPDESTSCRPGSP